MRSSPSPRVFVASLVLACAAAPASAAAPSDAPASGAAAGPAANGAGDADSSRAKRPAPPSRPQGNASAGMLHAPLRTLDPGREDVGALATSIRLEPLDLRVPTGFQRVYEVPGSDGELMRGNGALFAIFPRSSYRWIEGQLAPTVPPGTVFHIGMPGPSALDLKPPATMAQGAVGARVDRRVAPAAAPELGPSSLPRDAEPAAPAPETAAGDARFPAAAPDDPFAQLALGPSFARAVE
jgi:hypothetical protein